MVERLEPGGATLEPPPHLTPSPSTGSVLSASSPNRSRRSSDTGLGAGEAAASVALFPGSGTLAAATVGALGSVAAVAAGGVALLGGGVAAAAFKFSPSLNGETGAMSREERERKLEEIKKASEEANPRPGRVRVAAPVDEDPLATVLSARDNHRY